MATTFSGLDDLRGAVGTHLGHSDWLEITQERVNLFAEATDDHQWIHVDVERAKRESPFGGPIAHGYLTVSLISRLLTEVVTFSGGISMAINYGLNRVRFPAPVLVGARIRAGVELSSLEEIAGGVQAVFTVTIESEGGTKPNMVAESLTRFYA